MASSQSWIEFEKANATRRGRRDLRGFIKFAEDKQVRQLISRPFAFSYLMPNLNYCIIVAEYNRFLEYIGKCEQPGKKELSALIFPVFVHLYLFMLLNCADDEKGYLNAKGFFDLFHKMFLLKAKGYKDVLAELKKLKNPSDVNEHHYFSKFWKMKYIVKASIGVLHNLRTFLEDSKSKALVYILHFFLHFEDEDSFNFITEEALYECADNDMQGILTNVDLEESSPSTVSPVYVGYNLPYFCSADFNEKESEICIASHNSSFSGIESAKSFIYVESLDNSSSNAREIKLPGVSEVKYVPGKSNILLASYGNNVKLVDTTTGKDVFKYDTEHLARISSVDANASLFATASKDLRTFLWKFDDKVAVRDFVCQTADVTAVKFHPNGLYFATGSADMTILLWDIEKSIPIRKFDVHQSKITSLAFSSDGKMLASSDSFGGVKLWNITQGTEVLQVPDARASVFNLCFNDVSTQFAFCDDKGNFSKYDLRVYGQIESTDFKKTPVVMKFNKGDNALRRREWKIAFLNQIL